MNVKFFTPDGSFVVEMDHPHGELILKAKLEDMLLKGYVLDDIYTNLAEDRRELTFRKPTTPAHEPWFCLTPGYQHAYPSGTFTGHVRMLKAYGGRSYLDAGRYDPALYDRMRGKR